MKLEAGSRYIHIDEREAELLRDLGIIAPCRYQECRELHIRLNNTWGDVQRALGRRVERRGLPIRPYKFRKAR